MWCLSSVVLVLVVLTGTPFLREDSAMEHIDSVEGLTFTTYNGGIALALLTNEFSSAGLAILSTRALVSVLCL